MKILVIGNGFDMAHGLPTKYENFLEFCERVERIYTFSKGESLNDYKAKYIDNWKMNDSIKTALIGAFEKRNCNPSSVRVSNKALEELYKHIRQNTWLEYFLKCHSFVGENWIDFESEISRVIQSLDERRAIFIKGAADKELSKDKWEILMSICEAANASTRDSIGSVQAIDKFTEFLSMELEKLIRALEIYIVEFVGGILINKNSTDINRLNPDHVLSFNYSNTYERLYGTGKKIEYDYIHGKADISNTIESNNMVLGIEEYLPEESKDKDIDFIAFKKFYQRIFKGTGCEYKEWLFDLKEKSKTIEKELRHQYPTQIPFIKFTNDAKNYLYIFGHSLDVTDKDILRELILNDNVYTTIFYFNKGDLGIKIANLVKVIGQDELIRRTGGSTKTIEFKMQQDMVERI